MKKYLRILLSVLIIMFLAGAACDEATEDKDDLNPPLGLYSITGNGEVKLVWYCSNFESDFDGYRVYQYNGMRDIDGDEELETAEAAGWALVETINANPPQENTYTTTVTGLTNGSTYSFHVRAHNDDPDVSFPSNAVSDTPRDEILSMTLYDQNAGSGNCGFTYNPSSGTFTPQPDANYNDGVTDVMFESFNAGNGSRPGLVGINGCRLQARGAVEDDWDLVDEAPTDLSGYTLTDLSLSCFDDWVYTFVKFDGNDRYYGKIYINSISGSAADNSDVAVVWIAAQPDANNNELKDNKVEDTDIISNNTK